MRLKSLAGRAAKRLLATRGMIAVWSGRFGLDAFSDIRRLAERWNYTLDVAFDVGANDGATALKLASEFPAVSIFSFEPHPRTFGTLIEKTSFTEKIHAFDVAMGAECKELEMFEYSSPLINSLVPNAPYALRFRQDAKRILVKCTTVDKFCADHSVERIDILKIDTEGFDLVVLQGASDTLRRKAVRFIIVEFNDLHTAKDAFGGSLMPFDEMLHPLGYRFIATYNDYLVTDGDFFSVSNALFALPS